MSDSYRPQPWQVPTPSPLGAPSPMSMQVDVKLPSDVSVSDTGALMKIAHGIVQGNGPTLDRFVANARQQVSISGTNYYDRQVKGDNLVARYRYNTGQEKLNLEVYPTGGGGLFEQTSERNLDGYIAWIHGEPGYPHDIGGDGQILKQGPFFVVMNGYALEPQIQPRQYYGDANCAFYTVMFGKTALLCPSFAGDKDHLNPLVRDTSLKQPFRLIPDSSGTINAGSEIDGTSQGAIPEKFGYWIFDWLSEHNPASFILNSLSGVSARWNNPTRWAPAYLGPNQSLGAPKSMGGIYFPDTTTNKSPLVPRGKNVLGTGLSAGAVASIAPDFDCFIAEFYDRGKYTTLSQSWSVPQRENRAIAATNKPLFYGVFGYEIGYTTGVGNNVTVDLDPQTTKKGPSRESGLMGPHDYFTISGFDNVGEGPGDALTDAQKAQVEAWRQANNDAYQGWATQLQRDFERVNTQLTDPQMVVDVAWAHMVATISRIYRGNVLLYQSGIFISWKGDESAYNTNPDPNGPVTLPPWATSGVVLPDPVYNLVTSVLLKDGATVEQSVTPTHDYDLVLIKSDPAFLDAIRRFDAQAITTGGETGGRVQYDYADLTTQQTSDVTWTTTEFSPTLGHNVDVAWESITSTIVQHDWGWRTDPNVVVFGPGAYSANFPQAETRMTTIMTRYSDLRTQMDEINSRKPPDPTPFPSLGKNLSDFKYSKFGPSFNYNQNP